MKFKKLSGLILSAGLGFGVLAGCKSAVERDYDTALEMDLVMEYEKFLERYPNSQYIAIVKEKLKEREKRYYETAASIDTVEAYEDFLKSAKKYCTDSRFSNKAESRIKGIKEGISLLEKILNSSLGEAREKIVFEAKPKGYFLDISAHLLRDYSPEDTSPIVRGQYGSSDSIREYVKNRIASIYRIIFTNAPTLKLGFVDVECKHGVRLIDVSSYNGENRAMTLYKTGMRGAVAKRVDWSKITNEEIEGMWLVQEDILNSIQFQIQTTTHNRFGGY